MRKYSLFLLATGLSLFLAACGTSQPDSTANEEIVEDATTEDVVLATGPQDLQGKWTRALEGSATSFYFKDDGTYHLLHSTDPEALENSPGLIGEYWFDGSQLNLRDVEMFRALSIDMCADVGIYEVIMLETGNLLFRVVEDECEGRIDNMVGPGFVDIEYMPLQ